MSNPLIPNFNPEIGRLVTDRYDFQKHIDGEDFRQNALSIDLIPTLVVDGYEKTNVYDALTALIGVVTPPTIQDATFATKGILKLAGDLGGSADNVVVTRIQGYPISTIAPSDTYVLAWDGYTNVWKPTPSTNAFLANGDLSGNNIFQNVVSLTGTGTSPNRILTSYFDIMRFNTGTFPTITQTTTGTAHGTNLTIAAQSASGTNKNGGDVIILGGAPGPGGLGTKGGVKIQLIPTVMTPDGSTMIQAREVAPGRRVLGLVNQNGIQDSYMPTGTGDMVVYVGNAATTPSANPQNGFILYSLSGQPYVRDVLGNDYQIGSIPNPSIWGTSGQQTYTNRSFNSTTNATPAIAFSISLNQPQFINSSIKVDVVVVGKEIGSNINAAQYNLTIGYITNSLGQAVAIGTVTNADARTSGIANTWAVPTISISGLTTLVVSTGALAATNINWMVVTQMIIAQG
jgi:hypothetical protein